MKFHKTLLVGVLSLTLLSGCSLFDRETDVVQISPLPEVQNQFLATQVWSKSVGNGIGEYFSRLSPVVQTNIIYAASRSGIVEALDLNSGKQLWQINLAKSRGTFSSRESALVSGLEVEGNYLYVGSERGLLTALDIKTGKTLWEKKTEGEIVSKPVVGDAVVLVHTSNSVIEAFDSLNGNFKWKTNLDSTTLTIRGDSTPVIAHGAAIVGSDSGRVNAMFLEQGQLIWQQNIASIKGSGEIDRISDVDVTPVVVGNIVYAASYNGGIAALDLSSGQIIWHREQSGVNNFIVDKKSIYFVDQNDGVLSLSAENGLPNWKIGDLAYRRLTAPAMTTNYIIVADSLGYLHWINKVTGKFASQLLGDKSGFTATPIVSGNKLILQSKSGNLTVYTLPKL